MNRGQSQVSQFFIQFALSFNLKSKAIIDITSIKSIDKTLIKFDKELTEINTKEKQKFDFVFADLSLGMGKEPFIFNDKLKVNKNWNMLANTLALTANDGFYFGVVEPSIYFSKQGRDFLNSLEAKGYFCNLVLNTPEKLYYPQSAFNPILIGFQTTPSEKLFIAEIDGDNTEQIISNFNDQKDESIQNGKWVARETFVTFQKAIIEHQIIGLQTQYKDYKQYRLSDLATSINSTRETFEEKPNAIYIPKIGTSMVVSKLNDVTIKHQNVFQVILNPVLVVAEFLALFYQSELGKLILGSLNTGTFIPNITKSSIEESFVALPSLEEQKILIHTNHKLTELQHTVNELKSELSLNPKSANIILDKFDSISAPLKALTSEDEILSLIRKGENKRIEFKQTFSKNVHTSKKDKEIEKSSLKNIVGFLNAQGGTLLIGVADNGQVTGIEDDFFQSHDKYLLNFKNALNSKIGSEFYPLIDFDLFHVLDQLILRVDCKPSQKACFYDGNEFYVRTNPATDKLEGRQLLEYVRRRFKE